MRLTAQEQKLEDDIVQFLLLRNKDLPFDPVPESELLPPRLPWSRPIAQKSHSRDGIRRWDHNFIAEEPFEETFERHGPGAWSLSQNPTYATVPPPEPKRTKIAGHRYRKRTQAQPRRPQTSANTLCNRRPEWDSFFYAVPPNEQLHDNYRCYFDAPSKVAEAKIWAARQFRQELKGAQKGYEALQEPDARTKGYAYADTLPKETKTPGGISMTRFNRCLSADLEAQLAYGAENGFMPRPAQGPTKGPGVQKAPKRASKRRSGQGNGLGPGYGHSTFHKHLKGMALEGPFPHQQGKTLYVAEVNDRYTKALRRLPP